MKTSIITKYKKLPLFIRSHKIFTKTENIEKIFPLIGLDNCSEKVSDIDYKYSMAQALQLHLISMFQFPYVYHNRDLTRQIVALLKKCTPNDFISGNEFPVVPQSLSKLVSDFNRTYLSCRFGYDYYSKYYEICEKVTFKKDARVVFSSNKEAGMWDIATMSMRGISSCQSWNGMYKRNLVGSITDPYVGIIYLTNNKKLKHGTNMVKRALVRYVIHKITKHPALLLERIYPYNDNINKLDNASTIFIKFLQKKTGGKLPIITRGAAGYEIPNSKIVKAMSSCGRYKDGKEYCKSYRDSGITYAKSTNTRMKNIKAF